MNLVICNNLSVRATVSHAGIARYDFAGLVTDSGFDKARSKIMGVETARPDGFVSVFSDATLAIDSVDWGTAAGGRVAWQPPGALLVTPDNFEIADRYAAALCKAGFQRRAFTCENSALAWVHKQAEIRQQYAAWLVTRSLARLR